MAARRPPQPEAANTPPTAAGHAARRPASDFFARIGGDPLTDAFPPKRGAHPPSGAVPVPADQIPDLWAALQDRPRRDPSVAYVHIPFCETHCLFCGFYQNRWHPDRGPAYVDAVLAQARQGADHPAQQGVPLRALYLGGGTPTALATPDLVRLIEGLRTLLPLAPDCEITLEGRLLSLDRDKARAAFDAGVNRVSLGVQSFDERLRRRLGRRTGRAEAIALLSDLAEMDRAALVIDLIFGLPGQEIDAFAADVTLAAGLGLDGIDLYALNLIPGTPLLRAAENGKLTPAPRERLGLYYRAGAEAMAQAGWAPLSCSHWRARPRERSLYNFAVKSGAECLAFGAGAGGNLGGTGFRLLPDLAAYHDAIGSGRPPVAMMTRASPHAAVLAAIRAGMERGHLDPAAIDRAHAEAHPAEAHPAEPHSAALPLAAPLAFADLAAPLLSQWHAAGLIAPQASGHALTLAGRLWCVTLTGHLLAWTLQELAATRAPGPAQA